MGRQRYLPGVLLVLMFSGCLCDSTKFGTPNLLEPGYINVQRSHLEQFEPFCRSDIGPKIPGDRPQGAMGRTPTNQHLEKYRNLPPYTAYFLPAKKFP